ncbi:hypothetical protein K493DRAFT_306744, partial [Basidiobolus meristosporus CBS 931.73]
FLPWIAIGLVLLTIGTDETVYSRVKRVKPIAAGYIIMGIILAIWAFGFGSDYGSKIHRWFHPEAYEVIPDQNASAHPEAPPAMTEASPPRPTGAYPILPVNPEYKYRVRAAHPYTASREDPNEMSFNKGDVLEVVDTNGKWWHARKPDGTIGIIPSNYYSLNLKGLVKLYWPIVIVWLALSPYLVLYLYANFEFFIPFERSGF